MDDTLERVEDKHHSILLPSYIRISFARKLVYPGGHFSIVADASFLQYLVEEFISLGVINIAIPGNSSLYGAVDRLPDALSKRIKRVDENRNTLKEVLAILDPIADEFSIPPSVLEVIDPDSGINVDVAMAYSSLAGSLEIFLNGIRYEAAIDIDLNFMQSNLQYLLQESRNPISRANLVSINGILSTYAKSTVPTIRLTASALDQQILLFQQFVEDETYKVLSREAHLLGVPVRAQRARSLMGRAARELITKTPFRQITNLAVKGLATSTQIPLPDTEAAASLLKNQYLPPVVALSKAMSRARATWMKLKPEFVPLDGVLKRLPLGFQVDYDWDMSKPLDHHQG